jgi:hypothetical protein
MRKHYLRLMTKLLDWTIEAVRGLPSAAQDDLVLQRTDGDEPPPVALLPEERAATANSKAAEARGEAWETA